MKRQKIEVRIQETGERMKALAARFEDLVLYQQLLHFRGIRELLSGMVGGTYKRCCSNEFYEDRRS